MYGTYKSTLHVYSHKQYSGHISYCRRFKRVQKLKYLFLADVKKCDIEIRHNSENERYLPRYNQCIKKQEKLIRNKEKSACQIRGNRDIVLQTFGVKTMARTCEQGK